MTHYHTKLQLLNVTLWLIWQNQKKRKATKRSKEQQESQLVADIKLQLPAALSYTESEVRWNSFYTLSVQLPTCTIALKTPIPRLTLCVIREDEKEEQAKPSFKEKIGHAIDSVKDYFAYDTEIEILLNEQKLDLSPKTATHIGVLLCKFYEKYKQNKQAQEYREFVAKNAYVNSVLAHHVNSLSQEQK